MICITFVYINRDQKARTLNIILNQIKNKNKMGSIFSCLSGICSSIASMLSGFVSAVAGFFHTIISAITSCITGTLGAIASCLTCGKAGRRSRV
ncbi:MAG: hypothetical protein EXX96DRAFT_579662 [Benjaminiella poitrasii]|nr:MAG: hypothetical protein EXX96DRAFT_579662 [Benjaminiella poitrasii]